MKSREDKNHLKFKSFNSINNNIKLLIFSYLDSKDLSSIMRVNKDCNNLVSNSDKIWEELSEKENYTKSIYDFSSGKDFYKKERHKEIQVFGMEGFRTTFFVNINQSSKNSELTQKIQDEIKHVGRFFLAYAGKKLNDDESLHKTGIRDNSTVRVVKINTGD